MGELALALGVAVLLGLRHATDPDHLTAVSTLVLSEERGGSRRASLLGLAWGLGHATTLFAFGLPVVLLGGGLPGDVQSVAEAAIGVLIAGLALRLLVRWRRGYLHVHPHRHGSVRHSHPHVHEHGHSHAAHEHAHASALGRSPAAAFGIGLVHGVAGSAGASVIVVAAAAGHGALAAISLLVFALAAAASMASCSAIFGLAIERHRPTGTLEALTPALGLLGLAFGALYALTAIPSIPTPL